MPARLRLPLLLLVLCAGIASGTRAPAAGGADAGALRRQVIGSAARERTLGAASARLDRLIAANRRDVGVLQGRLAEAEQELTRWRVRLTATHTGLTRARVRLRDLRHRLTRGRAALAAMLRAQYTSTPPDLISVVLDARGFADLLERVTFARRVRQSTTSVVTAVREARDQTKRLRRALTALAVRQRAVTAAVQRRRDALAQIDAGLRAREAALTQARAARQAVLETTRARRHGAQRALVRLAAREAARLAAARARATAQPGPGGPWAIPWPIVQCESGGQNLPPNSASASGYYQMLDSTWKGLGGSTPHAFQASKAEQDRLAAKLWAGGAGAHNWVCASLVES